MNAGVSVNPCGEMSWAQQTTATVADLAAIELRRIVDVLQVEHASLFLHDADRRAGVAEVASVGLAAEDALPEHGGVVGDVMHSGRVHEVEHSRDGCSAIAVPLLDEGEAVGVLLVATVRESRRLGTFDTKVIARAAETLVDRIVAPRRRRVSDRFSR